MIHHKQDNTPKDHSERLGRTLSLLEAHLISAETGITRSAAGVLRAVLYP